MMYTQVILCVRNLPSTDGRVLEPGTRDTADRGTMTQLTTGAGGGCLLPFLGYWYL